MLSGCTFWVVFWPFLLLPLVGLPAAVGFFYVTTIVSVLCLKPTAPCHTRMSRGPMKASADGGGGQQSEIRTAAVDIVVVLCSKGGCGSDAKRWLSYVCRCGKELLHRQLWWKCVGRSGLGVSNVPRRLTSVSQLFLLLPNHIPLQFAKILHLTVLSLAVHRKENYEATQVQSGPSTATELSP